MQSTRDYLLGILEYGDYTTTELAEAQGMNRNTVAYHLQRAHKEGRAHIVEWRRKVGEGGHWCPIYRFGPGEDKPEPKRTKRDAALDSARHYKRHRALILARQAARKGRPANMWAQLIQG